MAAQGSLGQQHRLPQDRLRVVGRQMLQPALQSWCGGRSLQITEAVDRRHAQVKFDRAVRQPLLAQQFAHRDQAGELVELVLERFERGRHGAALGLAFSQRGEGCEVDAGNRPDLAAAEAVALQCALGADLQRHRHGRLRLVHPEGGGLAQGRAQQRQPLPPHAQGIGLVAQPEVQAAARAEALGHRRTV